MADDANTEAVRFFRDSSVEPLLAAGLGLRLKRFFRMQEDEQALQEWFEALGYVGVMDLEDLKDAQAHFEAHDLGFWAGHYTLRAGSARAGELSIAEGEVRLDDVVVNDARYEANVLTWSPSAGMPHGGSLTFAIAGDARANDFARGTFAKALRGTITREGAGPTEVRGTTFALTFDEAPVIAAPSNVVSAALLGADPPPAEPVTYATLDAWNDEYVTKTRALTSTTESEWTNEKRFKMQLFNDVGEIKYGDDVFANQDYTTSGPSPVNGKAHENNLVWDDTAGTSGTKGNIQFSTFKGEKIFKGTIRLKDETVDKQIQGVMPGKPTSYSTVDVFVITATVIGGVMMLSLIPLIYKGWEKAALAIKDYRTPEEQKQHDALDAQLKQFDQQKFVEGLHKYHHEVPTTAAEYRAIMTHHVDEAAEAKKAKDAAQGEAAAHQQHFETAVENVRGIAKEMAAATKHINDPAKREAAERPFRERAAREERAAEHHKNERERAEERRREEAKRERKHKDFADLAKKVGHVL